MSTSIQTDYGTLRRAYTAMDSIASGNVINTDMPRRTIMKLKRTLGVIRPVYDQLIEQEQEEVKKVGWDGTGIPPKSLNVAIKELHLSPVEIGVDAFTADEFGLGEKVPPGAVNALVELGPFFIDD